MSTFKNTREIYESAADCAIAIGAEMKHYPDNDVDALVYQEADRMCIYTQDNWDVCNIMRLSDEMSEAQDREAVASQGDLDGLMTSLAFHIWEQLINEYLHGENA